MIVESAGVTVTDDGRARRGYSLGERDNGRESSGYSERERNVRECVYL